MLKEFRDFIIKGNTLELAIGVILAVSFGAVVTALTEGVLMAVVAALFGKPSFESLSFSLNGTPIMYGRVITALVNLVLVGLVLFAIVKAINRMKAPKVVAPKDTELDLLTQIRDELRRRPA
ncbi:MAG TPA: large conductance mechanosensitive channel protein MscL [Kofleriaceae bacterium]|nr:large conductance mechanosensitive channel protein MscL [Kofleriaceae bacterium]